MKVAVITRHAVSNYGSLLQAIATQHIIENLGHSCEIIDYVRTDEAYPEVEKTLLAKKDKWNKNHIKRLVYLAIRQPASVFVGKKFEKAQKELLHLTARYSGIDQLQNNPPDADVYMTGSDQVWGPVSDGTHDSAYCLSFTGGKKIAFAASFGRAEMSIQLREYYAKWLGEYDHIAVREESAVQLLSEMDIEAEQVLDPTLLLDAPFWEQLLKPINNRKYVLIYQIHNDRRLGEYAKKVARAKGIKLIRVSPSLYQMFREGKFVWCPEVGEFLSYIKNAECMITDSFHGTAFAISFNVPFVEVLPNNNTGTRNLSILKMTGLSGRILRNTNDLHLANESIEYAKVNTILKDKRSESVRNLKEMIER